MENDFVRNTLAKRLTTLLHETGKTTREVAAGTGISKSAISNYCQAIREPDITVLYKLAEYFDVSSDWLIGITGDRKRQVSAVDSLGLSEDAIRYISSAFCDFISFDPIFHPSEAFKNLEDKLIEWGKKPLSSTLSSKFGYNPYAIKEGLDYLLCNEHFIEIIHYSSTIISLAKDLSFYTYEAESFINTHSPTNDNMKKFEQLMLIIRQIEMYIGNIQIESSRQMSELWEDLKAHGHSERDANINIVSKEKGNGQH